MITIRQLYSNVSKGQSAIAVKAIFQSMEEFYQKIQTTIKITGCKKTDTDVTIFQLLPSQTTKNLMYDVVLQLQTTTSKIDLDTPFKVYTNTPSFGYNFCYVVNRLGGLLYPNKYPGEFIQTPPKVRNPFGVGFDKHVFSAFRHISVVGIQPIIDNYGGVIPAVKSFEQKATEISNINEELKRSRPNR